MLASGTYRHKAFGTYHLTVRANLRTLRARVVDGEVRVSCPAFIAADELSAWLDKIAPKLQAAVKAAPTHTVFAPGTVFYCMDKPVTISTSRIKQNTVWVSPAGDGYAINLSEGLDAGDVRVRRAVTDMLGRVAKAQFPNLLAVANSEARRLRLAPDFDIAHGRNVRGTCYPGRNLITFSWRLCYMPAHLRLHTIRHELAHLTHPNHSAQFHALLNEYCGGGEAALSHELRHYALPF